ncbi:IS3 family transposase [Microbulbifer epialgicus]|uniref:IS3 family transposase n=1 Tax=Microbulbifer epialgicus TaxID=393907 RepID=A0ABV4P3W7_9GAMM
MQVNKSSYYDWCRRSGSSIDSQTWQLCHRLKTLFAESRQSLGSRQLENPLNRELSPSAKNQVWTTDITYIWTLQGWLYLAVVIDFYSRRIVGWHLDRQMEMALVSRALMMAVNLRTLPKGLLHHSDRGSQYASDAYQVLLKQHGMMRSMSRRGNCWANCVNQNTWSDSALN